MDKRGKSSPSNPSQNSFMQQSERKPSRTRSPRRKSPRGRMSRWPCKDYLRVTCNNSFCERWHPPECSFYKTQSGCRFGEKCSYAHRQVDEQPTKRSKTNNDKCAVAMLKKGDWQEREFVSDACHDRTGQQATHPDEFHEECVVQFFVSEMKHFQKDLKAKMYIPQESANQNVAIVGERNDEDHTVPKSWSSLKSSLMKRSVSDPRDRRWRHKVLWADRGRTSSSDRRKNRGSCPSIPHEGIPEPVIAQIVNMSGHTQSDGEDRQRFKQQVTNAQDAKIVSRHDPVANWWTSCEQARPASRKLSGGEAAQDHQEDRAKKESDRPAEDESGEQARENSIQSQHIW